MTSFVLVPLYVVISSSHLETAEAVTQNSMIDIYNAESLYEKILQSNFEDL